MCQGWKIVKSKDKGAIVRKSHYISVEELKKKMEESIEQVVCKSLLDEVENKDEGEVRDAHGVFEQLDERKRTLVPDDEWKTQIEERKRKLIQNVNLIQLPDGLKPPEEHKLLIVCG